MNQLTEQPTEGPARTRVPTGNGARIARVWFASALFAGVWFDLLGRSDLDGLAGAGTLMALALVVALSGRVRHVHGLVALAASLLVAAMLVIRTSPWLTPLNATVALGLVLTAAALADVRDFAGLGPGRLLRSVARVVPALVWAPALMIDLAIEAAPAPTGEAKERLRALGRGLGLAVPLLVVLGLLLASADAVFASFFSLRIDAAAWIGHGLGILAGVWVACVVLSLALDPETRRGPTTERRPLGAIEVATVLGGMVVLYGLFVVAQLVASGASETTLLRSTGLTRAEYARSGFFQLLWAGGLTAVSLLAIHRAASLDLHRRRWFAVMNAAAVCLTLVIVAVAIRRLDLYHDAFGLTMLRLYSTIFAWWLGAAFLVIGVYLIRPWTRIWWPAAVGVLALVTLVGVNIADPERRVVEHNLAHAATSQGVDVWYLASLSADAIPALVDGIDRLDPDQAAQLESWLCARHERTESRPWFGANLSKSRAGEALDQLCSGR